jgi:hypothetical protein
MTDDETGRESAAPSDEWSTESGSGPATDQEPVTSPEPQVEASSEAAPELVPEPGPEVALMPVFEEASEAAPKLVPDQATGGWEPPTELAPPKEQPVQPEPAEPRPGGETALDRAPGDDWSPMRSR